MARPKHHPMRRVLTSRLSKPLARSGKSLSGSVRRSNISRSRPGRSARLDTRTYQNSSNPVLRKLAFHRLVMQLAQELPKADLGLQCAAITTLQEATQNYLNEILKGMHDSKGNSSQTGTDEVDSLSIHIIRADVHNEQDHVTKYQSEAAIKCPSCKQKPSQAADYSVYDPEDTMLSIDLDQSTLTSAPRKSSRDFSIDFTLNIDMEEDEFHSAADDSHDSSNGHFQLKQEPLFSVLGLKTVVFRLFQFPATVNSVTSIVKRLHQSLGRMTTYFKMR